MIPTHIQSPVMLIGHAKFETRVGVREYVVRVPPLCVFSAEETDWRLEGLSSGPPP